MNSRQAVGLVARREIDTRVRSRSFLIFTGLMLAAVVGGSILIKLLGGDSAATVGVTDPALARPLTAAASSLGADVTVRTVPDPAAGTRQVRDGDLDALVTEPTKVAVNQKLDPKIQAALASVARQAALDAEITKAGGDPAAVNRAVAGVQVEVRRLDPKAEGYGERIGLSMFSGILVYLALMIYGQTVLQGVVEEKASRIVELLLTTIKPWQLMLGKVLGIGAAGLLQLVVVVAAGVATAQTTGIFSIPGSVVTGTAVWMVVWFLLGFLMYALMFAAVGALVSRQEDVGGVMTPVTMLLVVPYVVGVSIVPSDPESGLVTALSLFPLFSPTLMPMRAAFDAPAWQVALSLGLSVLTIVALVWLAGRVYRNAVLRTGTRIRLTDAFRDA